MRSYTVRGRSNRGRSAPPVRSNSKITPTSLEEILEEFVEPGYNQSSQGVTKLNVEGTNPNEDAKEQNIWSQSDANKSMAAHGGHNQSQDEKTGTQRWDESGQVQEGDSTNQGPPNSNTSAEPNTDESCSCCQKMKKLKQKVQTLETNIEKIENEKSEMLVEKEKLLNEVKDMKVVIGEKEVKISGLEKCLKEKNQFLELVQKNCQKMVEDDFLEVDSGYVDCQIENCIVVRNVLCLDFTFLENLKKLTGASDIKTGKCNVS